MLHVTQKLKRYCKTTQRNGELLKCVVAAMYSWQHCGTGTLSYRQPRHLVITDQWNGQQRAFAIKMFYKNNDSLEVAQREFRRFFNVRRHGQVPSKHTIKTWIKNFERDWIGSEKETDRTTEKCWYSTEYRSCMRCSLTEPTAFSS